MKLSSLVLLPRFSALRSLAVTLTLVVGACKGDPRAPAPAGTPAATPSTAATAAPQSLSAGPSATPVQSPDSFRVVIETSKGPITIAVKRALSPRAADRFFELVSVGYFNDIRFFRHVPGFIVQFGMHGDPAVNTAWEKGALPDEPMGMSNTRGTLVFATAGPNTRSNQFFFNLGDNTGSLDPYGNFSPFGTITEGLDVMDKLNGEYGEQPNQSRISSNGNEYLQRQFPALDYIKSARVIP